MWFGLVPCICLINSCFFFNVWEWFFLVAQLRFKAAATRATTPSLLWRPFCRIYASNSRSMTRVTTTEDALLSRQTPRNAHGCLVCMCCYFMFSLFCLIFFQIKRSTFFLSHSSKEPYDVLYDSASSASRSSSRRSTSGCTAISRPFLSWLIIISFFQLIIYLISFLLYAIFFQLSFCLIFQGHMKGRSIERAPAMPSRPVPEPAVSPAASRARRRRSSREDKAILSTFCFQLVFSVLHYVFFKFIWQQYIFSSFILFVVCLKMQCLGAANGWWSTARWRSQEAGEGAAKEAQGARAAGQAEKRRCSKGSISTCFVFVSFLAQLMFVIVFFWRIFFCSFCPAVPKEMDSQIKQCQQLSVEMDELITECTETLEKIIEKKSLDDILKDLATRTKFFSWVKVSSKFCQNLDQTLTANLNFLSLQFILFVKFETKSSNLKVLLFLFPRSHLLFWHVRLNLSICFSKCFQIKFFQFPHAQKNILCRTWAVAAYDLALRPM